MILIFDNSEQITERLIELIREEKKDSRLDNATTYQQAVKILQLSDPRVILLDIKFYGNKTIELLKKIKLSNKKTAVIILFNHADEQSMKQCKDHGADFFIDKYYDFNKIPGIINSIEANV